MQKASAPRATASSGPLILAPILKQALADDTVVIVDCPVDYSENMKLTKKLKELTSPV
jgi:acetolactate synthase I/II/III large subunit